MEDSFRNKLLIILFLWLNWFFALIFVVVFVLSFTASMRNESASFDNKLYSAIVLGVISFTFACVFYLNSVFIRLIVKSLLGKNKESQAKVKEVVARTMNSEEDQEEQT